jgi:hypothetical protein
VGSTNIDGNTRDSTRDLDRIARTVTGASHSDFPGPCDPDSHPAGRDRYRIKHAGCREYADILHFSVHD